jgi:very-short-patch-repair endonuclease
MFLKYNPKLVAAATELRNNSTPAEIEMWDFLKSNFPQYKFLRQKPLENFIVDFYCAKLKLIIEVDGEIHNKQKERDAERDNIFYIKYGIRTLRFKNEQIYNNKEYMKKTIESGYPFT